MVSIPIDTCNITSRLHSSYHNEINTVWLKYQTFKIFMIFGTTSKPDILITHTYLHHKLNFTIQTLVPLCRETHTSIHILLWHSSQHLHSFQHCANFASRLLRHPIFTRFSSYSNIRVGLKKQFGSKIVFWVQLGKLEFQNQKNYP